MRVTTTSRIAGSAKNAASIPLTVLIPALNEEENLPDALASVSGWASQVLVVDSGSTDRTAAIAREHGATVVQFRHERGGPKKKAWSLAQAPIANAWVLILDADERVTPPLRAEIETAIGSADCAGYYIDRDFVFMGRSLRCFRPNWNLRLFRREAARMEDLGLHNLPGTGDNEIHEHVSVTGRVGTLASPLLHDDYRGLSAWVDRHNRYATWEAHLYRRFAREPIGVTPIGFLGLDAFRRKRVLRRVWVRLPARPLLRFATWYVARRGFLDGRQGFVFCVLMGWYEFLIGQKMHELRAAERERAASSSGVPTFAKTGKLHSDGD